MSVYPVDCDSNKNMLPKWTSEIVLRISFLGEDHHGVVQIGHCVYSHLYLYLFIFLAPKDEEQKTQASGSFLMISSNLVSNVEEKDEGDWKSAIKKR